MATLKWKSSAFVPLLLLFFTLFNCSFTATGQVDICKVINCGQGTCQPTPDEFPGFKCTCNPGWKKVEILGLQIPTLCLLPNCTIDFKCGNGSPPPPPPPPLGFPFPNVTDLLRIIAGDPCSLAWCVDGTCERNGAEYNCKCHEGSLNLLHNPKLACFPKCSLGGDCSGFSLGGGSPPPPSPPPQSSGSGPGNTPMSCTEKLHLLSSIILLATAFLAWI